MDAPRSVIVPITNVYAKGGYTAQVLLGSNQQPANLILDSGSSTLVVQREDYDPASDQHLVPTSLAQDVVYGIGGWYGPVIQTQVTIGKGLFSACLDGVHLAYTKREKTGSFALADGIMGLAYRDLNRAYDLTEYLIDNQVNPTHTYPWYVEAEQADDNVSEFRRFLRQYPHQQLTPYFTQLEQQGVVGNQFGFFIHRASIYHNADADDIEQLNEHPLNHGLFVLGFPRHHTHLYQGEQRAIKVVDEKYYNVELLHLQVGTQPAIPAPQLDAAHLAYASNAIIDSGASMVVLPSVLFDGLIRDLSAINTDFAELLSPYLTFEGKEKGIPLDKLDLDQWPDLHFTFVGMDDEPVVITMTPHTYWQVHAPARDQASFQFIQLDHWPNQSLFGLPLMCNYYTLFDRTMGEEGAVVFADKAFNAHRQSVTKLEQTSTLRQQCKRQQVLFDHD